MQRHKVVQNRKKRSLKNCREVSQFFIKAKVELLPVQSVSYSLWNDA